MLFRSCQMPQLRRKQQTDNDITMMINDTLQILIGPISDVTRITRLTKTLSRDRSYLLSVRFPEKKDAFSKQSFHLKSIRI